MTAESGHGSGIKAGLLAKEQYAQNFADLHPPLSKHEAAVEADRCYFCFDAPCLTACPTGIDIPMFIRQISAGNAKGAAKTILDENILGGMCARVCPTETLCEQACVREAAEGKPVKIGQLQRFATDALLSAGEQPFKRGAPTGKRVAVIGSGPAGLACAHRLALHGHEATIFEARPKSGGLNEYGIAAYKTVDDFAQREIAFILGVGGIKIENGKALGRELKLSQLAQDFDAVFLGMGLAGTNDLGIPGEDTPGVEDAISYIGELRQTAELSKLPVGRKVVVIGGGMTAVDVAVQSKLLGAEDVTILYRRGKTNMKASEFEQDLAQTKGVRIKHWMVPKQILSEDGRVTGIECAYAHGSAETVRFEADMIFKAIGQSFVGDPLDGLVPTEAGRIRVDAERRTGAAKIWAGGDCILGGKDLTVSAVEDGKRAAESIHRVMSGAK
jgi:dihydropyrimidine dehydrogenase (NAD+) subunit PreT